MPTPITTVTKSFTYNIADSLYETTNSLNKTASATYEGPDRVWVFVKNDSGEISIDSPPLTSQEDGGSVPVPLGTTRVEVTAENDIVVLAMLKENHVTYADTSMITENLPDGNTIEYNNSPALSQTYDISNLRYNLDSNTWTGFDFITSGVTWEYVIARRNTALLGSDGKISPDMPDSVKQPWIEYRQALRDLPVTYGKGTDSEVEAWKVEFPNPPSE